MNYATAILKTIYFSETPLSPKELSEHLGLTKSQAIRAIQHLREKKLITPIYSRLETGKDGNPTRAHYQMKNKERTPWMLKRDGVI